MKEKKIMSIRNLLKNWPSLLGLLAGVSFIAMLLYMSNNVMIMKKLHGEFRGYGENHDPSTIPVLTSETVLEIVAEASVVYPDSILGDSCPVRLIVKSGDGNMRLIDPGSTIMAMIRDLRTDLGDRIKYIQEKTVVMSTNVYTTYEPLLSY
jgi:hypothetical protein